MKYFIYSLLIFELILGPINLSITPAQIAYAQQATECERGFEYNHALNRCVFKKDVIESKTEAQACNGLTGDAYKECFNKNVSDKLAEQEASGDLNKATDPKAKYMVPAMISIAAGYTIWKRKKVLQNCPATSVWLILGGGLSTLMGEFLSQHGYKKKIKGMVDKYKKRMEDSSTDSEEGIEIATTNQTVAFEFQIAQEEARRSAHSMREKTHKLAFALYTASVLAAIYEGTLSATSGGMTSECVVKEKDDESEDADKAEDSTETEATETEATETEATETEATETEATATEDTATEATATEDTATEATATEASESPAGGNEAGAEQTQPQGSDQNGEVQQNNSNSSATSEDPPTPTPTSGNYTPIKSKTAPLYAINPELFGDYYYIEDINENEVHEIVLRKLSSIFIADAYATTDPAGAAVKDTLFPEGVSAGFAKAGDFVTKMIRKPLVRAVLGGLLALNAKKTSDHAGDLARDAKERIKFLKTLKADFSETGGAGFKYCKEDDRKTTAKPACYCTTAQGTRDPRKANSPVCLKFFESGDPLGDPTKYGADYGESPDSLKGCFGSGGSFDPECKCKKKLDSRGKNSCSTVSGKLRLGNLAQVKGLTDVMKDTSNFISGNAGTGDLNTGSMNNLVRNVEGNLDKLRKRSDTAPTLKQVDDLIAKNNRQLAANVSSGMSSGSIQNPFGGSSLFSNSGSENKEDVLNNLKKEIDRSTVQGRQLGKSSNNGVKAKPNFDFNIEDNTGGVKIQDDYAKIMDKNFEFNDVNQAKEHDIFKIITNRYHRSGLKHLFDEGATKAVDAPAQTDIHDK